MRTDVHRDTGICLYMSRDATTRLYMSTHTQHYQLVIVLQWMREQAMAQPCEVVKYKICYSGIISIRHDEALTVETFLAKYHRGDSSFVIDEEGADVCNRYLSGVSEARFIAGGTVTMVQESESDAMDVRDEQVLRSLRDQTAITRQAGDITDQQCEYDRNQSIREEWGQRSSTDQNSTTRQAEDITDKQLEGDRVLYTDDDTAMRRTSDTEELRLQQNIQETNQMGSVHEDIQTADRWGDVRSMGRPQLVHECYVPQTDAQSADLSRQMYHIYYSNQFVNTDHTPEDIYYSNQFVNTDHRPEDSLFRQADQLDQYLRCVHGTQFRRVRNNIPERPHKSMAVMERVGNESEVSLVDSGRFQQLLDNVVFFATKTKHGPVLVQAFLTLAAKDQKIQIIERLLAEAPWLVYHDVGCFVASQIVHEGLQWKDDELSSWVTCFMETAHYHVQAETHRENWLNSMKHPHANHAFKMWIEFMVWQSKNRGDVDHIMRYLDAILEAVCVNAIDIVVNRQGVRIILCLIKWLWDAKKDKLQPLIETLIGDGETLDSLIKNQYANYVIQLLIDYFPDPIETMVAKRLAEYAQHDYANYVVQKSIQVSTRGEWLIAIRRIFSEDNLDDGSPRSNSIKLKLNAAIKKKRLQCPEDAWQDGDGNAASSRQRTYDRYRDEWQSSGWRTYESDWNESEENKRQDDEWRSMTRPQNNESYGWEDAEQGRSAQPSTSRSCRHGSYWLTWRSQ